MTQVEIDPRMLATAGDNLLDLLAAERRAHAHAKARLRLAEDKLDARKVLVVRHLLEVAGDPTQLGKTEGDKNRAIDMALQQDQDYIDLLAEFRACQQDVDTHACEVDVLKDSLTVRNLNQRERIGAL